MACYKFYQDTKHTIWQRTRFTVEAPTEEEAIRKAAALIEDGVFDAEPEDDHIRIGEPELLFDTLSELSTEENDGEATVEIYSGTPRGGRMIAENRDGAAWNTWWLELDAEDMERITGLRRSDFDPEKRLRRLHRRLHPMVEQPFRNRKKSLSGRNIGNNKKQKS